MIFFVTIYNLG